MHGATIKKNYPIFFQIFLRRYRQRAK